MANYDNQWSSANPGLLVIMLDQSGSMSESYQDGKSKAETAAEAVNRVISEIINKNFSGSTPKNRCHIIIIGYGSESKLIRKGSVSEFAANPLEIQTKTKKVNDGAGGLVDKEFKMPIWIKPEHSGQTNMDAAFKMAQEAVAAWVSRSSDCPAPVIINISDGAPYIGESFDYDHTLKTAKEVMNVASSDGNVLVFNAHIEQDGRNIQLPVSESEVSPGGEGAEFLYKISSVIPAAFKPAAEKNGLVVRENSRGCMIGCDAEGLIKLIDFGSSKGMQDVSAR